MDFLMFIDEHNGFFMVIITLVYVIATIAICVANIRSANATKKQIQISEQQFKESNRAFVTVDFKIIRGGLVALKITNNGKQIAQNTKIRINPTFIDKVDDKPGKKALNKLNESVFTIGVSQNWYTCIGTHLQLEKIGEEELKIDLSYNDCFGDYHERISIDFSEYFWALIYTSPEADILEELQKTNKSMESIDRTMKRISTELIKQNGEGNNA